MTAAEKLDLPPMTFADFVEYERTSDVKHEIWGGVLVAMAGGTLRHSQVAKNLLYELESRFRDSDTCEAHGSDLMVYQPGPDKGAYPDLSVVCGEQEFENDRIGEERVLLNPTMVVEVLSRSTAARDIGVKFQRYQSIPSLEEYVLIDPTTPFVQLFRRTDVGWVMEMVSDIEHDVTFQSIGQTVPMSSVYRRVELSDHSDVLSGDLGGESSE